MTSRPGAVFPLLSLRVSGLSPQDLDALATPETFHALDRARQQHAAAGRAGTPLTELLHRLIPALADRTDVRRAALRLRRDVHNSRLTEATQRAARLVAPRLDEPGRELLAAWQRGLTEALAAEAEAAALGDAADRAALQHAMRALRRPDIAATLALASPSFTRELLRTDTGDVGARTAPGSRLARTAVSYLTRAAIKTSPFGALTTLGLATLGESSEPEPVKSGTDLVSPRHLAVHLLRACAAAPGLQDRFRYRVNESLRRVNGNWHVLLPEYSVGAGLLPHHRDVPAGAGLYARQLDQADGLRPGAGPRPLRDWGVGSRGPSGAPGSPGSPGERARAGRWAAIGLLLPDTPWTAHQRTALTAFAEQVGTPGGARGADLAEAMNTLAAAEQRLPSAPAAERLGLDAAVRRAAADALGAVDAEVPPWLATEPLFHENAPARDVGTPCLPRSVAEDLALVADRVRTRIVRTALYGMLVEHFTARYGRGGVCGDILDFLYSFALRQDHAALVRRAQAVDLASPPGIESDLRPHGTVGAPAVTVFNQLASASASALHRGEYLLVVNRVSPGPGGLLARWAAVPGIGERMTPPLRSWVAALHPGCHVYQLSAGGDYSMAQTPVAPLFPVLRWPTDLRRSDETEGFGDLAGLLLAHEPGTGTLQLYDRDGAPVALPYLGVLPVTQLQGPIRLLATLSQPWTSLFRTSDERGAALGAPDRGPTARVCDGRVVFGRARWTVPATEIPRRRARESRTAHLARVDGWRTARGIPQQCFVHLGSEPASGLPAKPFWVDLRSAHSLAVLLKAVERADHGSVVLAEVLPGPGHWWLTDESGRARAAELAALLRLDQ